MIELKNDILNCFDLLIHQDGQLFECPLEIGALYDERKLHEVCINHRLAVHFENVIVPKLLPEKYYADVEFNREGINFKELGWNGLRYRVRPDIIIHNRLSGEKKKNFLVAECKKEDAPDQDKTYDRAKLEAFIKDHKYQYQFGLQVIYGRGRVKGTLLYAMVRTVLGSDGAVVNKVLILRV